MMKKNNLDRIFALFTIFLLILLFFSPLAAANENPQEEFPAPVPPVITGVTDGETYTSSVIPVWEDAEGTVSEGFLSRDGGEAFPFASGTEITEAGSYELTVTVYEEESGASALTAVHFMMALEVPAEENEKQDNTPPTIPVIEGIQDGETYYEPVAATWAATFGVTDKAILTKDGLQPTPYGRGTLISENGEYLLEIIFTDTNTGSSASVTLEFVLAIVYPVGDTRSFEANRIKVLKKKLPYEKRKLSTKLLQLVDEDFILPGETKNGIKEQMVSNKQIIPAGQSLAGRGKTGADLVYVYISLEKGVNTKLIEPYSFKVDNYDQKNGLAAVWVKTTKLEELASLSGVLGIQPVVPPLVNTGSVSSEGFELHRVNELWERYGQGGAGVKIGVISDGVGSWTSAAGSGDLPPDLVVLSNSQGGSEGTAMLEIIHDLAPEAILFFHDCGSNVLAFNEAIDNLAAAGCDIIVDDISWVYEPFFDDGIIASHISSLTDEIVYISSAGNTGGVRNSAHYQGKYCQYGSTGWHDFSGGATEYTELYVQIPPGDMLWTVLQWDDPYENSVGNSTNDYDLYLFDVTDESEPELLDYSIGYQLGEGYAPLEYTYYVNNTGTAVDAAISVYKDPDHEESMLELYMYTLGSDTYIDPTNIDGNDSIFGQAAVQDAIAVGAVNKSTPEQIADYSSRGPVTMRGGANRAKPDVAGIDGVAVTGAGGFPSVFYGTSAAAPHVAAIAGLIKGYFPAATPEEIRTMIYETAIDLGSEGSDYEYGHGRADALNLFEVNDHRPPGYIGCEVDLNSTMILYFDENIYSAGAESELKERITVTDSDDNVLNIAAASITAREVHIELTAPLSGSGNKLVIMPGTLQDHKAQLLGDLTVEKIDEDTTPPEYDRLFIGYEYRKAFIYFTEKIVNNTASLAELKNKVSCAVDAAPYDCECVAIIGNQLILSFAGPLHGSDVLIQIGSDALKDTNGNVKKSQITIDSLDTSPPDLLNSYISNGNKTITLNFNENILNRWNSDLLLKNAISLSAEGESFRKLADETSVEIDGSKLVVNFSQVLMGSYYRISLAANSIKDNSGNILTAAVNTGSIDSPPIYTGQAEVKNNNSRVSLLFSESIFSVGDAAFLTTAVSYAPDGETYNGGVESASINGSYLHIDLGTPLEGNLNKFRISEKTLKDSNNNVFDAVTETGPIAGDQAPPVYQDYSLSDDFRTLELWFNEEIVHPGTMEELKTATSLAADGVNFVALGESDSVNIEYNKLVINFSTQLIGPANSVKITAGAIKDTNGNTCGELIITEITGISQEARLSGLILSSASLSPSFNMDTYTYTASVKNISSITVTPTCLHIKSKVKVNGDTVQSGQPSTPINLNIGNNVISVLVTAEDLQTQIEYTITVNYSVPGGGSGGPSPIQPLRPLPPQPILINTITADDKALEKSLRETGTALLDLAKDSDGVAAFSPGVLTQLSSKGKPLLINTTGIKLHFYPNSLMTQELRECLAQAEAVVNIGIKRLGEREKVQVVARVSQGENTGVFSLGADVFELTVEVAYENEDGVPIKKKIEKFVSPISVSINLAALRPTPEIAGQLSGVRLHTDDQKNIIPIPLGGAYNSQNYDFNFYTDRFSGYTVMLFKYRTAMNMTIASPVGYVNGEIKTLDTPPMIINDRAMVPLRFIGEALGARFFWDEAARAVTFRLGLKEVRLEVGRLAPGLDSPPVIINDRTMVPVRYIAEAFGAKVNWYAFNNMVTVFKD